MKSAPKARTTKHRRDFFDRILRMSIKKATVPQNAGGAPTGGMPCGASCPMPHAYAQAAYEALGGEHALDRADAAPKCSSDS